MPQTCRFRYAEPAELRSPVASGTSSALFQLDNSPPRREECVLNIGKLSPVATEYYIGEVATSAEDYYSGRGEATGRWVGSLAAELGLSGTVDPEHFRRILQGKHPFTGDYLVTAQGSAA